MKEFVYQRANEGLLSAHLRQAEKHLIEKVLEDTDYNVVRTATILGVHRSNLYLRLRSHGITVPSRKDEFHFRSGGVAGLISGKARALSRFGARRD